MLKLQHNIVSILYVIKGLVEVHTSRMKEGRFKNPDEGYLCANQMLEKIYSEADRALMMTRKIGRTMAEPETGEDKISHEVSANLQEIWAKVITDFAKEEELDGFEVISAIPQEFPDIVCDSHQLTEILFCLIDNSLDAMGSSGKLIIRSYLGFKSGENKRCAYIQLSDTGPGMSDDRLKQLFEPFVTSKPLGKGSGLGLCLVQALVQKNGGSISVSSFKDCGTSITLTFPV